MGRKIVWLNQNIPLLRLRSSSWSHSCHHSWQLHKPVRYQALSAQHQFSYSGDKKDQFFMEVSHVGIATVTVYAATLSMLLLLLHFAFCLQICVQSPVPKKHLLKKKQTKKRKSEILGITNIRIVFSHETVPYLRSVPS